MNGIFAIKYNLRRMGESIEDVGWQGEGDASIPGRLGWGSSRGVCYQKRKLVDDAGVPDFMARNSITMFECAGRAATMTIAE